jgi:hypothetical protein
VIRWRSGEKARDASPPRFDEGGSLPSSSSSLPTWYGPLSLSAHPAQATARSPSSSRTDAEQAGADGAREEEREGGGGEGVAKSVGRGLYDARGRTRACYCLFMGGGRLSSALATAVAWRTYDPTHCRYKPFRLLPFVPFSFSPLFCLSAWTGLPLSVPTTLPLTYMLSSCCSPCRLSPLTSSTLPPSPRPGPTSSRGSYRAPTRSSWFVSSFSSAPFDMQRVCARVYDVHLPCGEDEDKTWS